MGIVKNIFLKTFTSSKVPGFLSKNKEKKRLESAKSMSSLKSTKTSIVLKQKYTLGQNLYSYSKYKDSDLDECRKKPIIRNSAPYMIEQKMAKEKEMVNLQKLLCIKNNILERQGFESRI